MELRKVGDQIEVGNIITGLRMERYGMRGGTYMRQSEIGKVADELFSKAQAAGYVEWLPEIACRLRLVSECPSILDSVMVLAKAHVTWSDICSMKS